MAGNVGLLTLPAAAPSIPFDKIPVGDPLRQVIGDFLAAHLNANLQVMWTAIGGGTKVVERVETNNPDDNTFVTSKLPCLCVFEAESKHHFERKADELWTRSRELTILWIPPIAVQYHKARRESFKTAVGGAIMHALMLERTPSYVASGDSDPLAATRGTNIFTFAKIPYQPSNMTAGNTELKIEISGSGENGEGTKTYSYEASNVQLTLTEEVADDGASWHFPAKLDATLSSNASASVTIQQDVP